MKGKTNFIASVLGITKQASTVVAYDAEDHKFAERYCDMYLQLFCVDKSKLESVPKFYIRDIKKALDSIPKDKKKALVKFFALEGGATHYLKSINPKDIALNNMFKEALDAMDYMQSYKTAYMYHLPLRTAIDKIAKKVYDPENKHSNVEKAKYAHMYYRYIKDFANMPYDKKNGYIPLSDSEFSYECKVFAVPDLIIDEYEVYYQFQPDDNIIIPLLDIYLQQMEDDCEELVRKDCQFDEDKFTRVFLGEVRKVKEKKFDSGSWYHGDYATLSGLKSLKVDVIAELCETYREYLKVCDWICEKTRTEKVLLMAQGYKEIEIPEFYGKITFKDAKEMDQFLFAIDYLHDNLPEMEFNGKAFVDYGFYEYVRA